jgi:hypothetical protein
MELDEAVQTEPVRWSEKDTHDIGGTETVHATVPKRSVDPKCIPKSFIPGTAACETSVHDVLTPQQFQDSHRPMPKIATKLDGFRARVSRPQPSKASGRLTNRSWLDLTEI